MKLWEKKFIQHNLLLAQVSATKGRLETLADLLSGYGLEVGLGKYVVNNFRVFVSLVIGY